MRLRVHDPEAELLLLRHQLRVVRRQVKRPQLNTADRAIMAALSPLVNRSALVGMLVQPETVLGWHRELVRRKWAAFGRRRGPGRPGLDAEIQKLILQMAKGNPRWGCVRVRGELLKLGHVVSATAIRKLLRRNRIGPAPSRSRQTWKAFLRAQASAIVLTDSPIVKTAVAFLLSQKVNDAVRPQDFELVVHQLDETDFRVETDLAAKAYFEDKEGHDLVATALLGIGGLNQRIEFMNHFNAMCGLRKDDLPLLDQKLGVLAKALSLPFRKA